MSGAGLTVHPMEELTFIHNEQANVVSLRYNHQKLHWGTSGPRGMYHHHPHFSDEGTEAQRSKVLPETTQLGSGRGEGDSGLTSRSLRLSPSLPPAKRDRGQRQ